jgi:hypothetical protein
MAWQSTRLFFPLDLTNEDGLRWVRSCRTAAGEFGCAADVVKKGAAADHHNEGRKN